MRLFVAVRPSYAAASPLAGDLGRALDERWHVTLAFLGDDGEPGPLHGPLAQAVAGHRAFPLRLEGAGTFGGRVLWAGVAGDVEALQALRADVVTAVTSAGASVDGSAYRPHVTVARGRGLQAGALAAHRGPEWQVREVELVASRLGGGPARHEVLERYRLAD